MPALMRTTMCGVVTRWRKHSVASAEISAKGSRAISAGASLPATATDTCTASVSRRASMPSRPRLSLSMPSAITASAAAMRWSISPCACACPAAKPLRCAWDSAAPRRRSASTTVMVGLPPVAKSSSNRYFAVVFINFLVDELVVAAALRDQDLAFCAHVLGEIDQQPLRLVDIAQAHGTERAHVVGQHLGGARRHIAEEEL